MYCAEHKKCFGDGTVIKEVFLETTEMLFGVFKNKTEIIVAIKEFQSSHPTITRPIDIISNDV